MAKSSNKKPGDIRGRTEGRLYTTKDIAEMCGVTEYTVRRWIGDKLDPINGKNTANSKKKYRFTPEQLQEFINLHASGRIKENYIEYLKTHSKDMAAAAAVTWGSRMLGASLPMAGLLGCVAFTGWEKLQSFMTRDTTSTVPDTADSADEIEDVRAERDLLEHTIGTEKRRYELQKLQSDDSKEAKIQLLEKEIEIRDMEAALMELDAKLKKTES